MVYKKTQLIFILILLTVVVQIKAVNEVSNNKKLIRQLEDLKDHLEEAIEKLDHNIKARQAVPDVQTPDNEYIDAIQVQQPNDLIAAAAVSQTPLPAQAMRINQNSGLRRRRSNYWVVQ